MQLSYLHKTQLNVKTEISEVAQERLKKLEKIELLLNDGCQEEVACKAVDVPRSTYFRWKKLLKEYGPEGLDDESKRPHKVRKSTWTKEIEQRVYHIRKQHPLWGKQKITVIYWRKYGKGISESTIGRIITHLIKKNTIMPVSLLQGRRETKKRIFNDHAQRWKYSMKARKIGEMIQIDHMTVNLPGSGILKHFTATCPITKWTVYMVYLRATSHTAAEFLKYVREQFPFRIVSIQVDGGSEFMGEFEQSCKNMGIPLYVLPPRSPEYNGNAERNNGIAKYDFYSQYDGRPSLHHIRKNLQKFTHSHNHYRPHQGIDLLTPNQFYEEIRKKGVQSHMC